MRRSVHRLISATTRFDSVTNGALSLMADVARLYLMRIGEASRARADLATCPKRCNSWDGQAHDTVTDDETLLPRRMSAGDFCEIPPSEERSSAAQPGLSKKDDADDDIDSMLDGLNLGCLLLHDMDECIADDIAGAIPPHLPPLVSLAEPSEEENIADLSVNDKQPTFNATIASTVTSSIVIETAEPENVAEGSPENTRAQVLQVAMSSLAELDPEIVKDKPLYAFYRQDTKFDATCAPDEALPDFEIPEDAYDSSVEVIARQLAKVDKIKPGQPMFLQGNSTQRNVLGDLEEQWRQARYSQLEDIDDSVAVLALQEMESSSTPLRPQRLDDSEDSLHIDYSADTHRDDSHVDTDIDMEQQEIQCSDIGLAEDVLDMDMDVDMDLDILGILPDDQEMDGSRHGTDIDEPLLESSTLDTQDHLEPAKEDVEEPLVPVDLPISSGLRGTDREHWAHEWLTPEMKDRLCRMSADDIVPCDSLFLDDPWITNRNAIDDIARAFVDSEGGGHLHEAMPSEKLGPHGRKAPGSSVSALRWTLHQAMQTRGASSTESLYTGRSSLAGGVAGDGVDQYISRMFSLIRPSAEEEAEQVVSGALSAAKDKEAGASGDSRKAAPEQDKLMVQLIAGAEKRVPWSQNKLDIHVIESNIANRVPQKAEVSQPVLPTSLADMPLASRLSFHPASLN
ncbi:hypothetical protein H4R26_001011 [Coemansia thaxteri]|uniref:Bromodomain associated domain-containing protein n=1 Tax=Coemansia thaxteri TaxID=2663907 RepID=A0A9W8ELK4_9FUNG|nr:hypothetical protein H4R26_001011 [Coemansia thaxteri]